MKPEDIFKEIQEMPDKLGVGAVFGQPVTGEGRTVIPVASVMYGFGLGFGQGPTPLAEEIEEAKADSAIGGGSGGAGASTPRAVVEITEDGVRVIPIVDESRIAMAGIFTGAWAIFWLAKTLQAIFGRK